MAEAFAGFVCGYALALIATPLVALALVRARVESPFLRRAAPEGTSLLALSVIIHGGLILACTAIGMLLGLLLAAMADRGGGLGSPNGAFTLFVLASAGIAALPLAVVVARWRTALLASGVLFAATFGWLMPYLAQWAPSGS